MTKQGHFHDTCRKMVKTGVYYKKGKEYIEENDRNTDEKIIDPVSCGENTGISSGGMFKDIKK